MYGKVSEREKDEIWGETKKKGIRNKNTNEERGLVKGGLRERRAMVNLKLCY